MCCSSWLLWIGASYLQCRTDMGSNGRCWATDCSQMLSTASGWIQSRSFGEIQWVCWRLCYGNRVQHLPSLCTGDAAVSTRKVMLLWRRIRPHQRKWQSNLILIALKACQKTLSLMATKVSNHIWARSISTSPLTSIVMLCNYEDNSM